MKQRKVNRGFTLIELLVVIAVISVLLAILIPALHKARQLSQRSSCQARLKHLSLAWNMYLNENDGAFYQGVNANLNYGGWPGLIGWWPRPLNPYAGLRGTEEITEDAAKAFCCPGDQGGVPPAYTIQYKVHLYLGTSYQTNIFLIGQDACGTFSEKTKELDAEISSRLSNLTINDVYNPSRLLLLGDYGWINQWDPGSDPPHEWKERAEWHGREDCFNLVFLDGHCGLIKIKKGIYVDDAYSILPFKELYGLAKQIQ
ncbi:type II secretion system protein [Planctomycetota bacterium]